MSIPEVVTDFSLCNIRNYGATGDGTTDDTNAIQSALNSRLPYIYIPNGVYIISRNLNVLADTIIIGDGKQSIIKLIANAGNVDMFYAVGIADVIIKNLQIDGNKDNQSNKSANTTCIQFHQTDDVVLENLYITGSLIDGVYLYDSKDIMVRNIRSYNNGYLKQDASGLNIDSCIGGNVSDIITRSNGYHGLMVSSCKSLNFNNIYTHNNGFDGIRAQYSSDFNTFTNIQSYFNMRGIYFTTTSSNNTIANSMFNENLGNGINLNQSQQNIFSNVHSDKNGEYGLLTVDGNDSLYAKGLFLRNNTLGKKSLTFGSKVLDLPSQI